MRDAHRGNLILFALPDHGKDTHVLCAGSNALQGIRALDRGPRVSGKRSARFGDDRALRFAAAVGMKIDDNPVSDLAKFAGTGGV